VYDYLNCYLKELVIIRVIIVNISKLLILGVCC
jgi:hypothetical protein